MWLAAPIIAAAKIKFDVRMLIAKSLGAPQCCAANLNAQFFVNFADERFDNGLTTFDFSAWKLPVASVRFAQGTLGKQHLIFAVNCALDDRHRNARQST